MQKLEHRSKNNKTINLNSEIIKCLTNLKGQSHEIFLLRFFSSISSFWSYLRHPRAALIFSKFSQSYCTFKTTPGTQETGESPKNSWPRKLFQT